MNTSSTLKIEKNGNILSGIKVIEFGHYIAGPLLGMILAEQGAEVIHIINPKEKSGYPIMDCILGRGKKHINLDLNSPGDLKIFRELIENCDIFIDNYAPGTLKKFGLDIEKIREKTNPGLIDCKILPFPNWNKKLLKIPGFEAAAGMKGFLYKRPMKSPYYHPFPIGSVLSALFGGIAIAAALYSREDTGYGEHIEVNLYESNLFAQILQLFIYNGAPRSFLPFKMVGSPFMGVWKCKDGRYIYLHITIPKHNAEILELIRKNGFEEEIQELYSIMSESTRKDPSLVEDINEAKNIKRIMQGIYLRRTADEWENLLGKDYCCIKIRTLEEWVRESIDSKNGDCIEIDDPLMGTIKAPGPSMIVSNTCPIISPGEYIQDDIKEIIEKWKNKNKGSGQIYGDHEGIKVKKNTTPLKGVRVIDMSRVIAGPFCARILAELGAEVISIQRPKELGWALSFHVLFNAGKRSVTIDFTKPDMKDILLRFIKDYNPDVFIQNYRSLEFSKQIGFDYKTINNLAPGIVYTNINGYGIEGEWQNRPAFEQVVQAVTGLQMGYVKKGRPKILPFAILDMGTGLLGAFSTILGLYHKKISGSGGFCHAHMTSMSMLIQLPQFDEFQSNIIENKGIMNRWPTNYDPSGSIFARIFETLTNYVMITGRLNDIKDALVKSLIFVFKRKHFTEQLKEIEFRIRIMNSLYLKMKLYKYRKSIAIVSQDSIFGFIKRYMKKDKSKQPIFCIKNYPGLGELPLMKIPVHLSFSNREDITSTPKIGQHSADILKEYLPDMNPEDHIIEYPEPEPLISWIWNFIVWGIYSIRAGNI